MYQQILHLSSTNMTRRKSACEEPTACHEAVLTACHAAVVGLTAATKQHPSTYTNDAHSNT